MVEDLRRWQQREIYSRSRNYTIAPDGTVTFSDKQFVGNPTPVTVKRVDKNAEVTATYTPTVTKVTSQELAQPA